MSQPFEPFIVDINNYRILTELGRGRFGKVMLAEKGKDGEIEKYAIRITSLYDDDDKSSNPDNSTKNFMREVGTYIQTKNHPVICKFYGFTIQPQQIILEYLEKGSLQKIFDRLLKKKKVDYWTGTMKSKTVFGIACALLHLQNQNVFHRYLTPSSILFDSNYEPRLVDFSYSKFNLNQAEHTVISSTSPIYRAPELSTKHYDYKVDNFSFGVILYQIITGREAFDSKLGINKIQTMIAGDERPPLPSECPKLANMINDLWSKDPNERPELIAIIKSLYDYDQELFPGTDLNDYNRYREIVWKSIDMTADQIAFINQPKFTEENIKQFQRQLEEAAKGNPKDITKVARSYEKGIGTPKDVQEAITWYQRAADLGEPEALYKIANFYSTGRHQIEASNEKYVNYLKQAFEKKYPPAVNDYAYLLLIGFDGIEKDEHRAIELLQEMANPPHNFTEAMYRLANYYQSIKNTAEAIKYFNKARNEGYEPAHIDYALMLLNGDEVTKDVNEGMRILKQAAERGFPVANYNLGLIYEHGHFGIEKNYELSYSYYKAAADKYYLDAMVKVGKALLRGKHVDFPVEKNEILAARSFQYTAEKKHPEGLHSWASCLQNGFGGTPQDIEQAIQFYEMAIEKGFVSSMIKLGDMYRDGIHGTRNLGKARDYYEMAKSHGSKIAIQRLEDLTS